MADNKWIHIENWMGKVLGLRANDLICFALIYSFSRDGESQFKGTLNYLAQCMFATEPTAISTLRKLLGVHLINKEDVVVNGKNRCYYSTNIIYDEGEIYVIDSTKEPLVMTTKEPLVVTTKESLVNNNSTINSPLINNNRDKKASKEAKKTISKTPEELQYEEKMKEMFPRIMRMEQPLTLEQAKKLKEKYKDDDLIKKVMSDMENWKKLLKEKVSAYQTINNWCQRELDRQ